MNKCPDCATPMQCAAVDYDCGHNDEKTPEFGDVVLTNVYNAVTGRYEVRIDHAAPHVLISDQFVDDAFNNPNTNLFGSIHPIRSPDLFVVLHGLNKQVRYKLTKHRAQEQVWEAQLVAVKAAPEPLQAPPPESNLYLDNIVGHVLDSGAGVFRDGERADEFVIRVFKELDGGS